MHTAEHHFNRMQEVFVLCSPDPSCADTEILLNGSFPGGSVESAMAVYHKEALEKLQAGDWDAAHKIVQRYGDELSMLIHAHLHRIEGDNSNAAWWYRRAGHSPSTQAVEQEWQVLYDRST